MMPAFAAEKGTRLHRYFIGIDVISTKGDIWWWSEDNKCWTTDLIGSKSYSNIAPCKTLKAFKRHLRKHCRDMKDVEITLCNRFIGYDVSVKL